MFWFSVYSNETRSGNSCLFNLKLSYEFSYEFIWSSYELIRRLTAVSFICLEFSFEKFSKTFQVQGLTRTFDQFRPLPSSASTATLARDFIAADRNEFLSRFSALPNGLAGVQWFISSFRFPRHLPTEKRTRAAGQTNWSVRTNDWSLIIASDQLSSLSFLICVNSPLSWPNAKSLCSSPLCACSSFSGLFEFARMIEIPPTNDQNSNFKSNELCEIYELNWRHRIESRSHRSHRIELLRSEIKVSAFSVIALLALTSFLWESDL